MLLNAREHLYLVSLLNVFVSTTTLAHQTLHVTNEVFVSKQVLDGDVHAIAPVVLGIGRDVDTLAVGVLNAQVVTKSEQVLQGEDSPH